MKLQPWDIPSLENGAREQSPSLRAAAPDAPVRRLGLSYVVCLVRGGWRGAATSLRSGRPHSRILSGSLIMLIGSGLVSSLNFGYNVAVARMLGPTYFGHAAAAVTLLMIVSAITLACQLVCAKFVARNTTPGARSLVYATLHRRAWFVGLLLGLGLSLFSGPVAQYLNLPSSTLVIVLASGVTFYIPLGVKRGGLQGVCAFSWLAGNLILEAMVKLLGAMLLIQLDWGVMGVVWAIAGSVVLAYFVPPTPRELRVAPEPAVPASFSEGLQAILFFVGQVIINNIDILLVKHFFDATQAGLYAAVALVGRVVYFCAWSVVSAMFPISAGARPDDNHPSVLAVPLGIVLGVVVLFILGLQMFPGLALRLVFGPTFYPAAMRLDSLLMLFAAATGAYSLAVVLMAYELSRKIANSGWIQLAFSGTIVIAIYFFHSTLHEVVITQLVLRVLLLMVCAVPFFRLSSRATGALSTAPAGFGPQLVPGLDDASSGVLGNTFSSGTTAIPRKPLPAAPASRQKPRWGVSPAGLRTAGLKRIRRVSEAAVITEFLRNEFHHQEFHRDRQLFEQLVLRPDISNEVENALRRALLFRRRATMWQELAADTEWWEVELSVDDVENLRVFPRAQWRKVASGSFRLSDIVNRLRSTHGSTRQFAASIERLSARLLQLEERSAILLIGSDERLPLTIIEGNHRVTAARLISPELVCTRFRCFCGFSPRMNECCWYETNFANLCRYARNRLKLLADDREAEIEKLLRHSSAAAGWEPSSPLRIPESPSLNGPGAQSKQAS